MSVKDLIVLVAGDSREERAELQAALLRGSAHRFDFQEAQLGRQVIAACCSADPPSCVFLNHRLADMNALEVLEALKPSAGQVPRVPVIIISDSSNERLDVSTHHPGAMGFLGKEWMTPDSAARTLDAALEHHSLMLQQEALADSLRERERTLDLALRVAHAGTFLLDIQTREVMWSSELESMMGYATGTSSRRYEDFLKHVHPADLEAARAIIDDARVRCDEFEFEFRVFAGSGRLIWLAGRGRVYARRGERPDAIMGVVQDVTVRKQMELDLQVSEQRLRLLQRAGGLGSWDWQIAANSTFWSKEAWQMFEPGSDMVGAPSYARWLTAIHPHDRERAAADVQRALHGEPYLSEFRICCADGSVRWLEQVAEVQRDGSGAPTRMVGTVRDITRRKSTDVLLRDSEERFRSVYEHAALGIVVADPAGRCEQCNAAYLTMTGSTEDELRGIGLTAILHPDDRAPYVSRVESLLREQLPHFEIESRLVHKTGGLVWVRQFVSVMRDAAGSPSHLVALVNNVTERKVAAAALHARTAQLSVLAQASAQLILHGAKPEFLPAILSAVAGSLGFERFHYHLCGKEPRTLHLVLSGGVPRGAQVRVGTASFGEHLSGKVAQRQARMVLGDLRNSGQPGTEQLVAEGATCYAGFPLAARGELLGVIEFVSRQRTQLTLQDLQVLQTLCDQIGMMLDRERLLAEARSRALPG